jgi:hypothetical protein
MINKLSKFMSFGFLVLFICSTLQVAAQVSIKSFDLVDAANNTYIKTLSPNETLDLNQLPNQLSIIANTENGDVSKVILQLAGTLNLNQTENYAPYALAGDNSGDYKDVGFKTGSYQLKAIPYDSNSQSGAASSIAFNIKQTDNNSGNTNQAPFINLKASYTVKKNKTLSIQPTVSDTTLPNGPLKFNWSKKSGVGSVNFNPSNALATSVKINATGNHILELSVSDGEFTKKASTTVKVSEADSNNNPNTDALRINVAGAAFSASGTTWQADKYFANGSTYTASSSISNTNLDKLYQSERFARNLAYNIPVKNGNYTVRLHFAEIYFTSNNKRVFNIKLENQTKQSSLDIFKEAGAKNKALIKEFKNISVNDGNLDIDLNATIDNGKLSAIEVIGSGSQDNGNSDDNNDSNDDEPKCASPDGSSCYLGDFCVMKDLLSLHYDHAPDKDDGHATVAGKTLVDFYNINHVVVGGAYGTNGNTYNPKSEKVMDTTWGTNGWLDAHNNKSAAINQLGSKWLSTINNGGIVWVAEGGQADISLAAAKYVKNRGGDTAKIKIIQHSSWNISKYGSGVISGLNALNVEQIRIDDGNNSGNKTAKFKNTNSSEKNYFVNKALASNLSSAWQAAFDYYKPSQVIDFSDTVEALYILGVGLDEVSDIKDFADKYMSGTSNSSSSDNNSANATSAYINVGGGQINQGSKTWQADKFFSGGSDYTSLAAISGTSLDKLYQSERFASNLNYDIPLKSGKYKVKLHFAEIYFNSSNKRVFNIKLENNTVSSKVDIYKSVGKNSALIKDYEVNVNDGNLDLNLSASIDNAKLSAIEVFKI